MPAADRIVGYKDITAITGKSRRTIRRWLKDGRLRRVKFAGVVGVWESELILSLGWHGTPGDLVSKDAEDHHNDAEDDLDHLADDGDADVA